MAFVSYFYPNVWIGGAATYAFNLCRALSKRIDLTVFVPKNNNRGSAIPWHKFCKVIDLPTLRFPSFSLMAALKVIAINGFDVIHSNSAAGFFLPNVSVETFHQGVSEYHYGLLTPIHKSCLGRAKNIIAVSESSKRELLQTGFPKEKITVVYNGVDGDRFSPNVDSRMREQLSVEREKVILYVGSEGASKRKNVQLLFETLSRLKTRDIILVIVGGSRGMTEFLSTAKQLGIVDKVRYAGFVSESDLPYYYSACDFLAYPSIHEGFGLVLLEAIACGKPFVSMDVGIASKLAEKGFGFVARTKEEFVKRFQEMLENPINVGRRGNDFVKHYYSWDKCAAKTIEVYKESCNGNYS